MTIDIGADAIESRPALDATLPSTHYPRVIVRRNLRGKFILDRIVAALILVALLPLLLIIALAIKLDSRGPVFFRQVRVGRNGRPFRMWKFRSMVVNAESARPATSDTDGVLFKRRRDPRVTRAGRVLRKLSLDELPQLINVLGCEMSLVGPRPALPDEVDQYPPEMRRRLLVKPGITGLWQVSGRSDLSWDDTVRLDTHYVEHLSLWMDLKILVLTPAAVFGRRGAY